MNLKFLFLLISFQSVYAQDDLPIISIKKKPAPQDSINFIPEYPKYSINVSHIFRLMPKTHLRASGKDVFLNGTKISISRNNIRFSYIRERDKNLRIEDESYNMKMSSFELDLKYIIDGRKVIEPHLGLGYQTYKLEKKVNDEIINGNWSLSLISSISLNLYEQNVAAGIMGVWLEGGYQFNLRRNISNELTEINANVLSNNSVFVLVQLRYSGIFPSSNRERF